jgi:hypothetical protein
MTTMLITTGSSIFAIALVAALALLAWPTVTGKEHHPKAAPWVKQLNLNTVILSVVGFFLVGVLTDVRETKTIVTADHEVLALYMKQCDQTMSKVDGLIPRVVALESQRTTRRLDNSPE